jgi:nucleoside-diphosphate-sugar epimerase
MGTVVVTGGAGYVGSTLIRKLLRGGYRVVCVDSLRFGDGALKTLRGQPHFEFRQADITDHAALDRIVHANRGCHAVVHLAAIVGDPACRLEPALARRTNLDSTLQLVKMAGQASIGRFVFVSTCSNYGKMAQTDGYVDESSPLAPVSLYAELKVAVEEYLLEGLDRTADFCPTCLRFATAYGLAPRMRFDLTVNEFTKELALGRELVVFGEQFWRPYCHVGDLAAAIVAVLDRPWEDVAYDVFNVGDSSENYTKRMVVDELLRLIPDGRIRYVQRDEDPRDYRVRFDKIRGRLGFEITRTVPEGMREIIGCLAHGHIADPDDQRYYNTPTGKQQAAQ